MPGTLLSACGGRYAELVPEGTRLKVLAPWEFVVLRAAAARILVGTEGGPPAEEVIRRADADLATVEDPAARAGLRQALLLLEYGTFLRGHLRVFSALAPPDQDAILEGLARSRFTAARVTVAVAKLLAFFYYYTDEATWAALGYEGPWAGRVPLPAYAVDYGTRNGSPFVSGSRTG